MNTHTHKWNFDDKLFWVFVTIVGEFGGLLNDAYIYVCEWVCNIYKNNISSRAHAIHVPNEILINRQTRARRSQFSSIFCHYHFIEAMRWLNSIDARNMRSLHIICSLYSTFWSTVEAFTRLWLFACDFCGLLLIL